MSSIWDIWTALCSYNPVSKKYQKLKAEGEAEIKAERQPEFAECVRKARKVSGVEPLHSKQNTCGTTSFK